MAVVSSGKDLARNALYARILQASFQGIQGKCIILSDLLKFLQDPCAKKSMFSQQG